MEIDTIMGISKIENLDFATFCKILASDKIPQEEKVYFVRKHKTKILEAMKVHLTSADFGIIMRNRPLVKFRPLKNSFTKAGDKIMLANALNIQPKDIDNHIKEVKKSMETVKNLDFLPEDTFGAIKTYVYRHGTKDEVVSFLDFELKRAKDIEKTLYKTLSYNSGGVADYFTRPIHRMDNKTLVNLYKVIDKNIQVAKDKGNLSEKTAQNIAQWAIIQIYEIQNNSKLLNAIKTFKTIS